MQKNPFEVKIINDEKMMLPKPAADPPVYNIYQWVDYDSDCKQGDFCKIDI